MPDIMPVSMQDKLRHSKSAVREQGREIINEKKRRPSQDGIFLEKGRYNDTSV